MKLSVELLFLNKVIVAGTFIFLFYLINLQNQITIPTVESNKSTLETGRKIKMYYIKIKLKM
ncbi:MAG: hypothetical protein COA66_13905 [Arcobacter sp.]|nr:MAG: hypothetical protein COA66_13905 [Arcobacter sp.]